MTSYADSKLDSALIAAVRKATDAKEVAPKQKHVRTCIMYTWDRKSSMLFWNELKALPFLADEVQCHKTLITIHKVMRLGHAQTLKDAARERNWLQTIPNALSALPRGYYPVIIAYTEFLCRKIAFHKAFPSFNGTFDYSEYMSLVGTADLNVGYETLSELMSLVSLIDAVQKRVFSVSSSAMGGSRNSCRLATIIPLIEESYGIYLFSCSMLSALHNLVGSPDSLSHLRSLFAESHSRLREFYDECRRHTYITSMIDVPVLGKDVPLFERGSESKLGPAPKQREDMDDEEHSVSPEPMPPAPTASNSNLTNTTTIIERHVHHVPHMDNNDLAAAAAALRERDANIAQLTAELHRHAIARDAYAQQLAESERNAAASAARLTSVESALALQEQKLAQMQLQQHSAPSTDALQKQSAEHQAALAALQAKYDKLASLYATLRKEHLDALAKAKTVQLEFEAKIKSKDEELSVLQAGLDQSLMALAKLKEQLDEKQSEKKRGLTSSSDSSNALESASRAVVENTLDVILKQCVARVAASHAGGKAPAPLNLSNAADAVLTLVESALARGNSFIESFNAYLLSGSGSMPSAECIENVIVSATGFAEVLESIFPQLPGVAELAPQGGETITGGGTKVLEAFKAYYEGIMSSVLRALKYEQRPPHATAMHNGTMAALNALANALEVQFPRGVAAAAGNATLLEQALDREMACAATAVVEGVAKLQRILSQGSGSGSSSTEDAVKVHAVILEAAMALLNSTGTLVKCAAACQLEIWNESESGSPNTASSSSSSSSSSNGSGVSPTSRAGQFYKKNNRWTQGLISAAKTIAAATRMLVTTADGVVSGERSVEELVVVAKQVSGATAQLVVSSRVKARAGSRTQEALEQAASRVSKNANHLVEIATRRGEDEDNDAERRLAERLTGVSAHDLRTQEMEQHVRILTLEKDLVAARRVLAQMRRAGYHDNGNQEGAGSDG